MFYYVYTDVHGYGEIVAQGKQRLREDMLLRQQNNFSKDSLLAYAKGQIIEWTEDPTEHLNINNCEIAMSHGMQCQCGEHE